MVFVTAVFPITLNKMPHEYTLINKDKQSSSKQKCHTGIDAQICFFVTSSSYRSSAIEMLNSDCVTNGFVPRFINVTQS